MRLIDADALLKQCRIVPVHDGENWAYTPIVTDGDILNAPAINPEDLRAKGRWDLPVIGKHGCLCSLCRKQADNPYDYCPNCGAKMEE